MSSEEKPGKGRVLAPGSALELWAGIECTVNRVGDQIFDQLEWTGHATRVGDLDLFADLGVRAMRYPVLWERTAPRDLEDADWTWADERLGRLRELEIRPIVALVHHGNGPLHTSLLDPGFPEALAAFAGAVARRYPWVESYIPVNEPLTTARFSGLYGLWYPHGRENGLALRILVTQCRAVALAMKAVRKVNPAAQLVQTEDIGKIFSTPKLAYQAAFENERRWLTFDLLCGRVDERHPLWSHLRSNGLEAHELLWFRDHPCPPDIIGFDHYLSSERYLDEHLERYPLEPAGGNGRDSYVDVLAARVRVEGPAGPQALLRETWERYRLPMAVTEAHNACYREEQLRWLVEMWEAAEGLRREGIDVRAVTAWSLLGAYGWDTLVTRAGGCYESGVFDLRAPAPRPTALAPLLRDLSAGRQHDHPLLALPGWWRRPGRLSYGFSIADSGQLQRVEAPSINRLAPETMPRLVVVGDVGPLPHGFAQICELRGIPYRLLTQEQMDVTDPKSVEMTLDGLRPWAVVYTGGYERVDDAESDRERCFAENAHVPEVLARVCSRRNLKLLMFSSDLVFDGMKREPRVESHSVCPLSAYGASKVEGERRVVEALPSALIIRTGPLFSPWDGDDFVTLTLRTLAARDRVIAVADGEVSLTYVPDLVHAALDLLSDDERGIWHLTNQGSVSWADLARLVAELAGLDSAEVFGVPMRELQQPALRPPYRILRSSRGELLPGLEDAVARCLQECEFAWREAGAARSARVLAHPV